MRGSRRNGYCFFPVSHTFDKKERFSTDIVASGRRDSLRWKKRKTRGDGYLELKPVFIEQQCCQPEGTLRDQQIVGEERYFEQRQCILCGGKQYRVRCLQNLDEPMYMDSVVNGLIDKGRSFAFEPHRKQNFHCKPELPTYFQSHQRLSYRSRMYTTSTTDDQSFFARTCSAF